MSFGFDTRRRLRHAQPAQDPAPAFEPSALASRPVISAVVGALGDAAAEGAAARGDVQGLESIMRQRVRDAHEQARAEVLRLRLEIQQEVDELRVAVSKMKKRIRTRLTLVCAFSAASGFVAAAILI